MRAARRGPSVVRLGPFPIAPQSVQRGQNDPTVTPVATHANRLDTKVRDFGARSGHEMDMRTKGPNGAPL